MHADLVTLVEKGKIPTEFAERLDKFSPGKYVLHSLWGVGKVESWKIGKNEVVIDFELQRHYPMGLKLAYNQLTPIPEGHFLIACFDDREGCWQKAKGEKTMLAYLRSVLEGNLSLREGVDEVLPMSADDIEKFLRGRIVPDADWKSWWEKARAAMRDAPEFKLPTKRGDGIVLREADSAAAALLSDYCEADNLQDCVRLLDAAKVDVLKGNAEVTAELVKAMEADIESGSDHETEAVLELIIIRDEMIAAVNATETVIPVEGLSSLVDQIRSISSERMTAFIGNIPTARQQKIYAALPKAFETESQWLVYATNIFLFGGARAVGEAARFIIEKGKQDQLFADIQNGVSRQSLTPDVLVWLCRERAGIAKSIFEKTKLLLGSAIINAIERDSAEGGPNRALRLRNLLVEDKELAPDLVRGVSESEARPFAKSIYDSAALHDLDRNLLLANMMKVHPALQEIVLSRTKVQEKQPLFVSLESYEKVKAEYDDLINVRIPQNKHDLTITRAEGDLRENGGYQDAKATRQVLMRRSEELARNLAQAHPTDFKGVDASVSGMGTRLTVADEQGNELTFTILGAWDSDPDKRIVSYTSRMGKKLIGHAVGDSFRLPLQSGEKPVKLTVLSIEAVNP